MVTQTVLVDWPNVTVVGPVAFDAPNGPPIGHAVLGGDAGELSINTKTPSLYAAERYGMSAFSLKVPNGKYTVKLHFSETYEGISGVGERVFSFSVEGKDSKDFDVTAKAGGVLRAYVETVEVEVKDGKLDITFTSKIENPQINALEIIPAS